jgi:HD-GYP domain-containing protein (c-di-GMP phosphodiesterase class II)
MQDRAGKEFEKSIFSLLEKTMSDDNIFQNVLDVSKLTSLLFKLRDEVKVSDIDEKKDIMGTALSVFGQIIDAKHAYTSGHSKRVSKYSLLIAIGMKLPHDEVTRIKWAGLVHDIGMVAIPSSILDKDSGLTVKEHSLLREHIAYTEKILEQVSCMKDLIPIAAAHHERFDGDGYPRMLKDKQIPLGARILSVADTFDSLTSVRGYRDARNIPRAIDEIKRKSRTQFDPEVVEAAIAIFQCL